MQKSRLIIILVVASIFSGLLFASNSQGLTPTRILYALASLYAPSESGRNDRSMTFGREHLQGGAAPKTPQQVVFK